MDLHEWLREYGEQVKRDWHALGVVDGLILGERLLQDAGMPEAALVLIAAAEAELVRIEKSHEGTAVAHV